MMQIELIRPSNETPAITETLARLQAAAELIAPGTPVQTLVSDNIASDHVTVRVDGDAVDFVLEGDDPVPETWRLEALLLRAAKCRGFLFLCVANSARSQMGEGVARRLAPADVRVQSAGSHPTGVRPEAATVLAEIGVDTSSHSSKNVKDIDPATVDVVVTLCAEEECPVFLGDAIRLHWGLPDPAAVTGDDTTRLDAFRAARDELEKRLAVVFSG